MLSHIDDVIQESRKPGKIFVSVFSSNDQHWVQAVKSDVIDLLERSRSDGAEYEWEIERSPEGNLFLSAGRQ